MTSFTHNKCNLITGQITQPLKKPQSSKHRNADGERDGEDNNDIQRVETQKHGSSSETER